MWLFWIIFIGCLIFITLCVLVLFLIERHKKKELKKLKNLVSRMDPKMLEKLVINSYKDD